MVAGKTKVRFGPKGGYTRIAAADVAYGSIASIERRPRHVGFTLDFGHIAERQGRNATARGMRRLAMTRYGLSLRGGHGG